MLEFPARRAAWVSGFGRRWLLAAVAVAALVALAGTARASAATLKVCPSGCTYSTIQGAIDHAHSGDKIKIAAAASSYAGFKVPGGNVNGLTNVTLTGAGAGNTTIGGGGIWTNNGGTLAHSTVIGNMATTDPGIDDNSPPDPPVILRHSKVQTN